MKASYAFHKPLSPVNRMPGLEVTRHQPAQFMALCQFDSTYWEFDKTRNYAPVLVFNGVVERLDSIETKFPGNIDTVYFNENKPRVQFRYHFDEDQLAELAKKGFWSEEGVNVPGLFTTAKMQLETYAVVEEVMNEHDKRSTPIFNVEMVDAYMNTFDSTAYDLAGKFSRKKADESKIIETTMTVSEENTIAAEVEAAKAAMLEQAKQTEQASYKPLTKEELDIRRKSANISEQVGLARDELKNIRDADNARVEAERAAEQERLKAEQDALAAVSTDESGQAVEVESTPIKENINELAGYAEENKFSSNGAIFNADNDASDEELPESVASFMKKLGAGVENNDKESSSNIKNDKRDNNSDSSGAASGAQGLGVYTFEDRDTAQFEIRTDEGKGNEKTDDESTDEQDESDNVVVAEKSDKPVPHNVVRNAQFELAINDVSVTIDSDDKSDRSK